MMAPITNKASTGWKLKLADHFLVLNAGSSSLKFAAFKRTRDIDPEVIASGQVARLDGTPHFTASLNGTVATDVPVKPAARSKSSAHSRALDSILGWLDQQGIKPDGLVGVGHRIVHGGTRFTAPVTVGDSEVAALDDLKSLAPLHMIFGTEVLRHVRSVSPQVPQIACFDTAFHASQPEAATRLAIPEKFHLQGYRRYGFHGLNYEHVVSEIPRLSQTPLPSRLLVFHLGSGASIAAIKDGRSVATTMGYSTLDGLVMGTRSGSVDPGVLIALMRDMGMHANDLEDLLYRKSGLLALSGKTSDMRQLLSNSDAKSTAAVEHYCYWAARQAASLVAALGGLDAVVFTGGVGENAWVVRAKIIGYLLWLGLKLDDTANEKGRACISAASSGKAVWIVPANEELAIARHVTRLLPH
jgi:acetate kinase